MRIFLTGGTGFIGSHVLRLCLLLGHEVVALRRSKYSKPKIFLEKEPIWLEKDFTQLEVHDFQDINVVIHLAAHSANVPYDSLLNCIKYNVSDPLFFLQLAKKAGIKNFVIAGTCFEYGKAGERYDYIPVDCPLEPTNNYSISKAVSSILFQDFAMQNNLSLSYFRLFHVFGEGEAENRLWPSLKRAAFDGADFPMTFGQQVRDFIEVEKVASQFISESLCMFNSTQIAINYRNIGSGSPKSILEFCEYWWNYWNASGKLLVGSLPYRDGETMRYVPKL